ncbi:MAG TPA: hypothetical protein VFF03_09015 [Rhodocyclaceae bacterium]|nr:hypothetical protein [Rhodocyclaceae bacterium]
MKLTAATTPPHTHSVGVYPSSGNITNGLDHHIAAAVTRATPPANVNLYAPASANTVALDLTTVSTAGGDAPHDNMQPWLALNYFICTTGVFPPRP